MSSSANLVSATLRETRPNVADLGAASVVRPRERCTVLVVGGAPANVDEVTGFLDAIEGYQVMCAAVDHSPNALVRLEAGGVCAVLAFDDLVGRSVQRAMVEREISAPVLMLVETPKEDRAVFRTKMREDGAAACLFVDELSGPLLQHALLGAVEARRMLDAVSAGEDSGALDPQTGLYTRHGFLRRLGAAIEHSEMEASYRYAVLYVDVSRVKVGNRLDAEEVAALRAQVGRRLCRVANDHVAAAVSSTGYAVLFRGFEVGDELEGAELIRKQLQRQYALGLDDLDLDLGFGLARGRGLDADANAALARACASVKVPKAVEIGASARERKTPTLREDIASQLANALEHDEFSVTYQPIVQLESGMPFGFEALIRWNHPDGVERPAAEFINAANDTNLIVPIGYWCLEAAMRQMADWHRDFESAKDLAISINLSTPQVLDPLFVARVRSMLMTTGLEPKAVRFEIEAGTIAEHNDAARDLVHGLVDAGTKVWVEDYGLSECTVDDLRDIPLDGFKIDRRFVSKIDGTEMTSGRIRHIVTAAQALGLRTLGEGIENALQANVLRWLGCTLGQGYLFARPLAVGDVFAYLAEHDG
ncbi:MAG: EAL domain-containing protein [Myxococcota bacterium]